MKKLFSLVLILCMITSFMVAPARASTPVARLTYDGNRTVNIYSLDDLSHAIEDTGNSVVTLLQDCEVSGKQAILASYSFTLDLNGFTLSSTNNALQVSAAGSQNSVTTVKNGVIRSGIIGVRVDGGGLCMQGVTVYAHGTGPAIGIYETANDYNNGNVLENCTIIADSRAAISFNHATESQTAVGITVTNSTLASLLKGGSPVFASRNRGGTVALGKGVTLYSHHTDLSDGLVTLKGTIPPMQSGTHTFSTVFPDISREGLNKWAEAVSIPHNDVPAGAWYYNAVEETTRLKLMDDLAEGKFAPDTPADRSAVVEALWRMAGSPAHTNQLPFTDLADARYVDSVRWSYATEVVNGTSATTFSPNANVTRAQLTTLMYRYLNYMGGDTSAAADLVSFPDAAQVPDWAKAAMAWACGAGIIQGTTGEGGALRLDPNGNTTRAQLATVLLRFRSQFLDNAAEDEAYKTITGREYSSFQSGYYGIPDAAAALYLKYPDDWTLQEADGPKLDILRNGNVIGSLSTGIAETEGWKTVSERAISYGEYTTRECIEKNGTGKTLKFRYRYSHEYSENGTARTIDVIVDATEMGESIRSAMYSSSELKTVYHRNNFGTLSELKNGRLLLLGNSFISTSEIGNTLGTMLRQGKGGSVKSISRSYATVSTFANDTSLLSSIRNGSYDAVFLCGLYSASEVTPVETVRAACAAGGAKLILLPAYNENRSAITQAAKSYPSVPVLDWKGEIDNLISSGKDKWDFCINDQHTHSTPLAGYVGAHMIYRAIYGQSPSGFSGSVTEAAARPILGDYIETGVVQLIDPADIFPIL